MPVDTSCLTFVLVRNKRFGFRVITSIICEIEADDLAMLKFGFEWVKLFAWGITSKKIRKR